MKVKIRPTQILNDSLKFFYIRLSIFMDSTYGNESIIINEYKKSPT